MNEIAVYEEPKPLTAQEIRAQVNLIQEVMKAVMQQGQHYGKIPGAGDKPTLLKPGAEKIMTTFRLSADPEVEDLSLDDVIRYRVKCRLITQTGHFKGAGVGECSSEEEKYKWRSTVSEDEWKATSEERKRIAYKSKWENNKKVPFTIQQVRTNPYDLANTVLKMAKKRALVDAVLTVTAASDIFTQDIEDMPEEYFSKDTKQPQSSKPSPRPPVKDPMAPATEPQQKAIHAMAGKAGISEGELFPVINQVLAESMTDEEKEQFVLIGSTKELTKAQASKVIEYLNAEIAKQG